MQPLPPTIIIRHPKENLKKCSLRGLEPRTDFRFLTYPVKEPLELAGHLILDLEGPPLSAADCEAGLLLIDATWRYAALMTRQLAPLLAQAEKRSIPSHFRTAYPRRQTDCPNPDCGLASIEALYIAYHLMGRDPSGLLDGYYWKEPFLKMNGLT
jgi:pre-rRNA-processing protein TSR3